MFENDDNLGLDVDDEFLNVVFENEERYNNNTHEINGKLNSDSSIQFDRPTALPAQKCSRDQHDGLEYFDTCRDSSISSLNTERSFPESCGIHNLHHKGENDFFGGKENKRKASPPLSRAKRERKFPGPAGLLPDRKSQRTPLKLDKLPEAESPSVSSSEELCSQGRLSGSVLEEGPWQRLLTDLGPHVDILDVVNVASVKRKAAARCFVGKKVPLLAAVLHHLDVSSADPCVILRDTSGEIHGTLHREVWQQFAAELVVGSVIVIRNVGLLSTGISSRRHYLNITANNLATIYSANPEKPQKSQLHLLTSNDFVNIVDQWRSLAAPPRSIESPSSSLFNNSLSSSPALSPQINYSPCHNGPRHPVPHQASVRPTTFQNMRGQGRLPVTPQQKPNPLFRPGKKLFPANSSPNTNQNIARTSNSQCADRLNQPNPNLTRNIIVNNSFASNSGQRPSTSGNHNSSHTNDFKFDPVVLRNMSSDTLKHSIRNHSNSNTGYIKDSKNSCAASSPSIILSQSSQVTQEERSAVESMFEGLDADSLFDDDF
ncbi:uncharacterized protein LOC128990034 [Macrosteles quadrilineatus]|uniref:uncharacterized protein LOC128990034 n=1 Tax=Macrosteles quadrilineatus TaxID=74068 RepID=UPI0023E1D772|nr:uncharacterized protein LOC128990034 [Macrosteles quadrilineatus]